MGSGEKKALLASSKQKNYGANGLENGMGNGSLAEHEVFVPPSKFAGCALCLGGFEMIL